MQHYSMKRAIALYCCPTFSCSVSTFFLRIGNPFVNNPFLIVLDSSASVLFLRDYFCRVFSLIRFNFAYFWQCFFSFFFFFLRSPPSIFFCCFYYLLCLLLCFSFFLYCPWCVVLSFLSISFSVFLSLLLSKATPLEG